MTTGIYQHFRPEERILVDQLRDYIATAQVEYRPVVTPFANPRTRAIARILLGDDDSIGMWTDGGFDDAEWQRIVFAPDYFTPEPADYQVQLMGIKYPTKFAELHHSTILGTLVHQGIEREVFGDIETDGTRWQVAVDASMTDFFVDNVDHIGKVAVRLVPLTRDERVHGLSDWEDEVALLPGLRVDALVSHVYHVSRQRAKELVEHGDVTLNWQATLRPDAEVAPNDMVSVRGFGRIAVDAVTGQTAKGKLRVETRVIRKRRDH
ncbi:RNA-binding protein [Lacticaseibacillus pantheris]|jgi:RNA-binding protein YlmH|uniref:YlmH family RNA-binding protein n=1 Tax=Lacticaseibacillus pantheris TaxID=171523 RepID=UPI00265B6ED0|nr:YlmH/Sll1252 family protein [Lacticaseibacillus pantheris]WKF84859.1 YlmH/Sll1252 family protein [Lacticaseibacillus pantheris]